MDLTTYANSHLGQHIDNGQGGYAGECVSLAISVAHDVYNVPYGTLYCSKTEGARDLFEQFDGTIPQYFDKIPNDPNDVNQLPDQDPSGATDLHSGGEGPGGAPGSGALW